MSRRPALVIFALGLLATFTLTTTGAGATDDIPVDNGTLEDEIPAQCRTIIGCPDAGPEPENPGDRGGYAQLLTLGVLAVGIGFIMIKVFRAAQASQPDRVE